MPPPFLNNQCDHKKVLGLVQRRTDRGLKVSHHFDNGVSYQQRCRELQLQSQCGVWSDVRIS